MPRLAGIRAADDNDTDRNATATLSRNSFMYRHDSTRRANDRNVFLPLLDLFYGRAASAAAGKQPT
jgi:hypothetical protein